MFFHAFSSTKEFCVSTELLRNYKSIDKIEAFHDFKVWMLTIMSHRPTLTLNYKLFISYNEKIQSRWIYIMSK